MKINPSQSSNRETPKIQSASGSSSEIVIPLSGDGEQKQTPGSVQFDKDGYPVPDGKALILHDEEEVRFLWGLFKFKKGAEYEYKADGKEYIQDIKEKFHLKDGAIHRCNSTIRDDGYQPRKGTVIYFMKEDVNTGR